MFKRIFFFILFLCSAYYSIAAPVKPDSLSDILQLKDQYSKEKKLIAYIKVYFAAMPADSFATAVAGLHQNFLKYNLENAPSFNLYIESIYQRRILNVKEAENELLRAIELVKSSNDHYLLHIFFSNLAFLQTSDGNAIGAISSFRIAKKEAVILNDAYLQVVVDINISDIYYRYDFYGQSLYYLTQAQAIIIGRQVHQPRIKNIIYYNKSENYFRMRQLDSLKTYNQKLKDSKDKTYKLYTYITRTNYYIFLLNHDYKNAISLIISLQKDSLYKFEDVDKQNLADAWFNTGELDSAKHITEQLLTEKAQNNHPEIKYHLYEVLGEIAERQNNEQQAANNFKMALQQSKENVSRLVQVGDISSQMKIDEMENYYTQQDEIYKNQQLWLILLVVVAFLTIAVIAMFYRNAKQKRHYEKLLFVAKKEELAYINSHDIRRHLTNILGIIDVVKHSENKEKEYLSAEEYLFYSAEQLDEAIKNISEKLNEEIDPE